jgi:ergothioneine biosynthesis protein EgtB
MAVEINTQATAALQSRFRAVRAATLAFTRLLTPEDLMVQSSPDASPVKWHLAHTSWFFETFVLTPYARGYTAFHPEFHWLFNSYYTSLGEMPAKNLRASFSRPPLEQIMAYRAHVDRAIEKLLSGEMGADEEEILRRMALGHEHEQQHLELIATDIKHALFINPLHPAYLEQRAGKITGARSEASFVNFEGGLIDIGITPDVSDPQAFAFDNETPQHKVYLASYSLSNRLVTVAEYLAFMNDNGYTRPELWLSEGWSTMRGAGWQAPLYWRRTSSAESGWEVYTMAGFKAADDLLGSPVCHISFFEADAFARWKGCRLPTEFEWEHACTQVGQAAEEHNMLEGGSFHPVAAAEGPGLQQMLGDAWEWTASGYSGYPGYKPLPGALGEYNGKFMSSQVILRGGSCVTPRSHIRATYRNFFPPATRWQFSGLRLAKDI